MTNHIRDAHRYQQSAFKWIALAQKASTEEERAGMLKIAQTWLELAHDAFDEEEEATLPGRLH